jgi:plastocyanin
MKIFRSDCTAIFSKITFDGNIEQIQFPTVISASNDKQYMRGNRVVHLVDRFIIIVLLVLFASSSIQDGHAQTTNSSQNDEASVKDSPSTKTSTVIIPNGAANPEVDLTLQKVGNWYVPKRTSISVGDTVIWKNEDTEPHSVTSGLGAGIQSVQTNEKGKPDGIFDSGLFKSGESWSRAFYNPGTYNYFCTLHPWMEAVVVVSPALTSQIPNYPVDASGNKQNQMPIYVFTKDGKDEIGLQWSPVPILTGKTVTFFVEFFDVKTNTRLQLAPYDFVILQNGKELDRIHALSDIGSGVHKYVFSRAGPITVRIENLHDNKDSFGEFNTIVYPNPDTSAASSINGTDITRVAGGTEPVSRFLNPLTLVLITYGVIISLPVALGAFLFMYKKGII